MQVNKLRWINNDLNKQVFDAVQRGHRLAAKLGYQNLEEAEEALATQQPGEAQSQIEQLSQQPPDKLATHVHDLQVELISHVQLSKSTLAALGDALQEMTELREENSALRNQLEKATKNEAVRKESSNEDATEVDFLRAELAALKQQYTDLQRAKEKNDQKHHEDFKLWKSFKDWLMEEKRQEMRKEAERPAKRRRLSPSGDEAAKENGDLEPISPERLPRAEWEKHFGGVKRRLPVKGLRKSSGRLTRSTSPGEFYSLAAIVVDHLRTRLHSPRILPGCKAYCFVLAKPQFAFPPCVFDSCRCSFFVHSGEGPSREAPTKPPDTPRRFRRIIRN